MIDKRLMLVKHYFDYDEINMQELADYLQISSRQLSRLLNGWQQEGFIHYKPGVGRGNKLNISYLIDVEKEIFFEIVNSKDEMTLLEIKSYLELPWQSEIAEELETIMLSPYSGDTELSMMDYLMMIPKEIHPAHAIDMPSVHVIQQVYETLYKLTDNGTTDYQLLRYDEWKGNALHLYLEMGVLFSDRTLLTSKHVKNALDYLKDQSEYQFLLTDLASIEIVDDFHLVLHFTGPNRNISYLLAEPFASIYKAEDDRLGTGPYMIAKHVDKEIVLKCSITYRFLHPDITKIYLFTNNKVRQMPSMLSDTRRDGLTYLGDEYILFNKRSHLSKEQRLYLKHLIVKTMYTKMPPKSSDFIFTAQMPEEYRGAVPSFDKPLKLVVDKMFLNENQQLCNYLNEAGIIVEMQQMDTEEFIKTDLGTIDADFVWMCETYHQTQPLKTISLLTYCKFKEWFQQDTDCLEFLRSARVLSMKALKGKAEKLIEDLIEDAYFVPFYKWMCPIALPKNLKNCEYNPYGTFKYHKVVRI